MSERLARSCEMLLRAAVRAAQDGGSTYQYFEKEGSWEASMRQNFAQLEVGERFDGLAVAERSEDVLRKLNSDYNTRHKVTHLPDVNRCLIATITAFLQTDGNTISLIDSCEWQRDEIHGALVNSLACAKRTGSRPYSLVSKFLHFAMPDTFAVFDDQAATSIAMWRFFAFACETPDIAEKSNQFSWRRIAEDKGGSGYKFMLEFYRIIWKSASSDLQNEAMTAALQIETIIRERHTAGRARVTVLDLINKLLWRASGNPIVLGLAEPPCC